jgi:uncharacterized phiE125 gp8 family phage protein
MNVKLITPATLYPIDLASLKLHLRLDSGSFSGNIDETISIAPGSHAIANNYTTHKGAGVSVLGYNAVVAAHFGVLTVGGVVDIKIQESDTDVDANYTDWATGAFTQVTISASSSTQEKEYTGTKAYIRTVAKVITQAGEFSTTVIRLASQAAEDDLLTELIETATNDVENDSRRQIINAVWEYYLQEWPDTDRIKIPFGNLQTTDLSVKWKDTDGTETTLTLTTDYLIETNGDQCGFIVLPYGGSWPSGTLYPSNPITIKFTCGYGATASSVPSMIKSAIKLKCTKYYEHRGDNPDYEESAYQSLVNKIPRLYDEF